MKLAEGFYQLQADSSLESLEMSAEGAKAV